MADLKKNEGSLEGPLEGATNQEEQYGTCDWLDMKGLQKGVGKKTPFEQFFSILGVPQRVLWKEGPLEGTCDGRTY